MHGWKGRMTRAAFVSVGSKLERIAQIPAFDYPHKIGRNVFAVDASRPNAPGDFLGTRAAIRPLGSKVDSPHLWSDRRLSCRSR